jgi:pimeloyl-ACP methyl ester carboxylesterase
MPNTTANGIQIEYETFGERTSPPLLLIMGLSAQMIGWEEEFCKRLVEKGFFVIHGSEDPLLPVEHGKDTAKAIPDAEMLIIDGMGHCLPKAVWTQIVDAIANHANQ